MRSDSGNSFAVSRGPAPKRVAFVSQIPLNPLAGLKAAHRRYMAATRPFEYASAEADRFVAGPQARFFPRRGAKAQVLRRGATAGLRFLEKGMVI